MELLTDFSRKMTLLAAIWEFEKSLSHGKARPAEREGFEPSVDLRPHRFSRPTRSAAPAPLRIGRLYYRGAERRREGGFGTRQDGQLGRALAKPVGFGLRIQLQKGAGP